MDRLPGDPHHADAIRHEGLRANVSAWARDDYPVEIPDALLRCEPLAHLDEQLGLQLGEPWQPATHRAGEVHLREPVRRDDVRVLRVADTRQRSRWFAAGPDLVYRTHLMFGVQHVLHGRLVRLVMRGQRTVQ